MDLRAFAGNNPKSTVIIAIVIVLMMSYGRLANLPIVKALKKTFGTAGGIFVAGLSVADEIVKDYGKLVKIFGPLGSLFVMFLIFTTPGNKLAAGVSGRSLKALKGAGEFVKDLLKKSPKVAEGLEQGDEDVLDDVAESANMHADVIDRLDAEAGNGDAVALEKLEIVMDAHTEAVARAFEAETSRETTSDAVEEAGESLEAEAEPLFDSFHPVP